LFPAAWRDDDLEVPAGISISYGLAFGEHRLGNLASRLTGGGDEVRLVGAVKPAVGSAR